MRTLRRRRFGEPPAAHAAAHLVDPPAAARGEQGGQPLEQQSHVLDAVPQQRRRASIPFRQSLSE